MEDLKTKILQVTESGKNVILAYYPQSEPCFTHRNRAFAIRDERTPSAYVKYWGNKWVVTDFGGDGRLKDCFAIVMEQENKTFKEALSFLADKYLMGMPNDVFPIKPLLKEKRRIDFIPTEILEKSVSRKSDLVEFLFHRFEKTDVEKVCKEYKIGATRQRETVFWQIDENGKVRTGKIMRYDVKTRHRMKGKQKSIDWVHTRIKNVLSPTFNISQCLFGEHLLAKYPEKNVALVESEKTAVVCSIVFSQYVWVATGGKCNLTEERIRPLQKRRLIVFPDTDVKGECYQKWSEIMGKGMFVHKPIISTVLENTANFDEKGRKIDIADWILDESRK